jgi:hypothetical protein
MRSRSPLGAALLTLALCCLSSQALAQTTPSIDTSGAGSCGGASSATLNCDVTTPGTGRIIAMLIGTENNGGSCITVSSITGSSGLTWAKRGSSCQGTFVSTWYLNYELWWAFASARQTAATQTINLSASNPGNTTVTWFSATGVGNTSAPWDSNASACGTLDNSFGSPSNNTTAQSTNTAHDVIIAGWLHHAAEAATFGLVCGSCTALSGINENHGTGDAYADSEFRAVSTTQSGTATDFGSQSLRAWVDITDALADVAGSSPGGLMFGSF